MRNQLRIHSRPVGMTLVEILMAMTLFLFIMGMVMHMMTMVQGLTGRGTINLQNLQEARLAMSSLRRDFLTACPVFSANDTDLVREKLRQSPIRLETGVPIADQSIPILVSERELIFQRFIPESAPGQIPLPVEPVHYAFDQATGRLTRTTPRMTTVFQGIRAAAFKVYVQQANPKIPLLWVQLEVRQTTPGVASGPTLALSTTIYSMMAADLMNHPEWYLLAAKRPR
ncbi:MAG TPA: hypothetical protein PKM25_14505 [Candidatus Ozemobacteraceae bacterium]|nr:hypothetical protein [Candidatus Ozemobacteraceae bacterium]